MLKFYCFLIGEDYEILKNDTPSSQKKVKLLASSLFIPTLLWCINGYLLSKQVLQCSLSVSIITAIICMFFIFSIEKAIVMVKGSGWVIGLRILMGLIVALLGSAAIDEVLFDSDITIQVAHNKSMMRKEELYKADMIDQNMLDKQAQLVNTKYATWQKATNDAKEEADGSGGSGQRGVSAITKIKENIATQDKEDYQNAKNKLDNLNTLIEEKNKQIQLEFESNFNSHSILLRIKALFDIVVKDKWMLIIYSIFTLLMLLLEFMVVIVKFTSSKTNYERKLEMIEQIGEKRMEVLKNNSYFNPIELQPQIREAKSSLKKASTIFSSSNH